MEALGKGAVSYERDIPVNVPLAGEYMPGAKAFSCVQMCDPYSDIEHGSVEPAGKVTHFSQVVSVELQNSPPPPTASLPS